MSDDLEQANRYRLNALSSAVESFRGSDHTTADVVTRADEFLNFIIGMAPSKEVAGAAPARRTRKTAAEPPAENAKPDATAASTSSATTGQSAGAAVADDDFLSEEPPKAKEEKPLTLADVRAALVDLQTVVDRDTAMKVLKDAGKADSLGGLKPELFKAVIEAAKVAKAKGK